MRRPQSRPWPPATRAPCVLAWLAFRGQSARSTQEGTAADDRSPCDAGGPAPAQATAQTASDLDRGSDARRCRAPARHGSQLRALARAGDEEAPDAPRPDDREHVLRILDPNVLELRARREA